MIFGAPIPLIMPELMVAAFSLILLLMATVTTTLEKFRDFRFVAFIGAATMFLIVLLSQDAPALKSVLMAQNDLIHYGKMLVSISFILALMYLFNMQRQKNKLVGEEAVLLFTSVLGAFMMISAEHFLMFYLGLELMSFSFYILTASNTKSAASSEAGLKYFLLGGLASSLLLYGLSLIYAVTGDLAFTSIAALENISLTFLLGSTLVFVGVLFKLSIVPFHMWTPDVYAGAPTPVTAHMAMLGKVAAVIALIRLMQEALPNAITPEMQLVLMLLAAATMLLGAFVAIIQTQFKRLLAYSSITHVGFILAALSLNTDAGYTAALLYLTIYILNTAGVFGVLMLCRYRGIYIENINDIAGLAKAAPALTVALLVFMLSLAGIPPLAGFFAKLTVFQSLFASGQYALVGAGVLASIVALYYSLKIARIIYFDEPVKPLRIDSYTANPILYGTVLGLALLTLIFGLFPNELMALARGAF